MYKESDHIHIIAICAALGASVRVEYMDRGSEDAVVAHDFPGRCHCVVSCQHSSIKFHYYFR